MTAALALHEPVHLDLPDDLVAQAELFAEASISPNDVPPKFGPPHRIAWHLDWAPRLGDDNLPQ